MPITEHHFLGLTDGSLRADDQARVARIGELMDDVAPDTVLTFDPTA